MGRQGGTGVERHREIQNPMNNIETLDKFNDLNNPINPPDHDEVVIFGSNLNGFHGAGAAGLVFRGSSRNDWRTCPIMQKALKRGRGYIGLKAIFGQAYGYQNGAIGASYGIVTITRPGVKKSIPIEKIRDQSEKLVEFMRNNPKKTFRLTNFGASLAGYYEWDMKPIWDMILREPNAQKYEA